VIQDQLPAAGLGTQLATFSLDGAGSNDRGIKFAL